MRRLLASWAILLGVVAFVCLPLAALAQRRGGIPPGLNWNRGRPASSATVLNTSLTGNCEGVVPTGLTFARAGPATCTRTDGTLVTLSVNQPRLEAAGFLREDAASNAVVAPRDLSDASWVLTNMAATPGASGTSLRAQAALASACVTLSASGVRTTSLYVRRVSGTGPVSLTRDGGTTVLPITGSLSSTPKRFAPNCRTDDTRCVVVAGLSSSVTNPQVCIYLDTDGDEVLVDYVQDEAGPVATSPIVGSRVADSLTGPTTGFPTTSGAVSVTHVAQDNNTAANRVLFDSRTGTNGLLMTRTSGNAWQARLGNGTATTNASTAAQTWTAGQAYSLGMRWANAGNFEAVRDGVALVTVATSNQPTAHAAAFTLGGASATGWFRNLCISTQPTGACP